LANFAVSKSGVGRFHLTSCLHDLKSPLRTLEAFSTFLSQDYAPALGDEGREYIDHLIQASRALGALIDDLLVLSRAGRVMHAPRPFSWDEARGRGAIRLGRI